MLMFKMISFLQNVLLLLYHIYIKKKCFIQFTMQFFIYKCQGEFLTTLSLEVLLDQKENVLSYYNNNVWITSELPILMSYHFLNMLLIHSESSLRGQLPTSKYATGWSVIHLLIQLTFYMVSLTRSPGIFLHLLTGLEILKITLQSRSHFLQTPPRPPGSTKHSLGHVFRYQF